MRTLVVFVVVALLLIPTLGCGKYVRNPSRMIGARNFQWTGDPIGEDDTILADFFVREDGTSEWVKFADDIPWTDLTIPVEVPYTLLSNGTKTWYRVDVQATIGGELFEYSCVSDDWIAVGWLVFDCFDRAAE